MTEYLETVLKGNSQQLLKLKEVLGIAINYNKFYRDKASFVSIT